MKIGIGLVGLVLGLALMVGCSTTAVRDVDAGHSMRDQARGVTILRGDGSGSASWDEVVADMASADVVLFGEMHGHPLGLAVAQELWEDILIDQPDAVLSMEFYERDQQIALDDYLNGVTDREKFEKAAKRNKGNNAPGHARMIDAAKEAGRPVIGANAPRRYVSIARKQGYEALEKITGQSQGMFEIPIGEREGGYKDRFMELMGGMSGHSGEDIAAGFFRSQSVWDATMGDSVVDGLEYGSPVAHVVGYFHVQYGFEEGGSGLIDAIRVRSDRELKIVTIIQMDRGAQDELDEDDAQISDYVVYVGGDE